VDGQSHRDLEVNANTNTGGRGFEAGLGEGNFSLNGNLHHAHHIRAAQQQIKASLPLKCVGDLTDAVKVKHGGRVPYTGVALEAGSGVN
jgi:hypothetical protein